jgi:uncharacterized membrane-anchored protein
VAISVGLIVVLTLANLRGTRESGRVLAVPTYTFVGLAGLMFLWAAVKAVTVGLPPASTAADPLPSSGGGLVGLALVLLLVRAFASGCTALTGVEAISNGVPSFAKPKARNGATTLGLMGVIAVVLFGGITVLAVALNARAQPDGNPSVLSQIAAAVYGGSSPLFYLFQAATAAILVLAANTAFNGFPTLASNPGPRPLPAPSAAQPRGPAGVLRRHRVAGRRRVDHRVRRQPRPAHPALHHRGVHQLHPLPGRDGPGEPAGVVGEDLAITSVVAAAVARDAGPGLAARAGARPPGRR